MERVQPEDVITVIGLEIKGVLQDYTVYTTFIGKLYIFVDRRPTPLTDISSDRLIKVNGKYVLPSESAYLLGQANVVDQSKDKGMIRIDDITDIEPEDIVVTRSDNRYRCLVSAKHNMSNKNLQLDSDDYYDSVLQVAPLEAEIANKYVNLENSQFSFALRLITVPKEAGVYKDKWGKLVYLNRNGKVIVVATDAGDYNALTATISTDGLPLKDAPYKLMKFVEAEEN